MLPFPFSLVTGVTQEGDFSCSPHVLWALFYVSNCSGGNGAATVPPTPRGSMAPSLELGRGIVMPPCSSGPITSTADPCHYPAQSRGSLQVIL